MENELIIKTEKHAVIAANQIIIIDETTHQGACGMLEEIKAIQKDILAFFDPEIKRLREPYQVKLNEKKEAMDELEEAEKILKKKIKGWWDKVEEENRRKIEAARKEREALEQAGAPVVSQTPDIIPDIQPVLTSKGISFSESWDWEMVNQEEVQREYMVPDDKTISKLVKALGDKCPVNGIRVFKTKTVRARGNA